MGESGNCRCGFDMELATESARSFSVTSGIPCFIISSIGELLHSDPVPGGGVTDSCTSCLAMHARAGRDSGRFGGRYIYACPVGFVFFASPVVTEGIYRGALIGGPVLISEGEDLNVPPGGCCSETVVRNLSEVAKRPPDQIRHCSHVLFMAAAQISGLEYHRWVSRAEDAREQADIGQYIHTLKENGENGIYPMETEKNMLRAIAEGNRPRASSLLNDILGHIFFSSGGQYPMIRIRVLELIVLLSRAAVNGGADPEDIFEMNFRYLSEIDRYKNVEDLTSWLSKIITRYTDIVFNSSKFKHTDVICKAVEFMKQNYMRKITLEDVADYVYLSPSYLSKIFKEETGGNLITYLNGIRIDKSKLMLISTNEDIIEICEKIGFEDQSYFCKVFKKMTGVTPGKFRASRGNPRIDHSAEKNHKAK